METAIAAQSRQVLDAILWKIYQYSGNRNGGKDTIALSQLEKLTGLSRRRVCEALQDLTGRHIISAVKRTREPATYRVVTDCSKWKVVRKNALVRKNGKPSALKRQGVVRKNAPTEEIRTTEETDRASKEACPSASGPSDVLLCPRCGHEVQDDAGNLETKWKCCPKCDTPMIDKPRRNPKRDHEVKRAPRKRKGPRTPYGDRRRKREYV